MKTLLSTLFGLFMILSMNAQVGVNNPTPEQALDVNGKVKLTNDATAPTAGTMRYDATSSDFEGYDGAQWNSFTQNRSSGLPSNPVPVFGISFAYPPGNSDPLTFKIWTNSPTFLSVPAGKYLIVTAAYIIGQNASETSNDKFTITLGPVAAGETPGFFDGALLIDGRNGVTEKYENGQAPLFIIGPGKYLRFENSSESSFVSVAVRGFLVDDLNF